MARKSTPEELVAVTARVVDKFTSSAMLFTALDVSNAVKQSHHGLHVSDRIEPIVMLTPTVG